jgi:hypothetical protein
MGTEVPSAARDEMTVAGSAVPPPSSEIGAFEIHGRGLTASLAFAHRGRVDNLTLFVEPFGGGIAVEVYEAVLDYVSLGEVAALAAAKLNTSAGRTLLDRAWQGRAGRRRRGPRVRVALDPGRH